VHNFLREGSMKFFLDTANVEQIKEAVSLGLIEGVTTNPTLIAKEGKEFDQLIQEICEIVEGHISVEIISSNWEDMIKEAMTLSKISPKLVMKIPMSSDGLKATKHLSKDGIKVNVTLVFSPLQALMAAKAGAIYISPFVGRLDDISHRGMDLIREIITILDNYQFEAQLVVASIRNPIHVLEAALMGAHVATIPFPVLQQMINHPLTDIGIKRFFSDWEKVPKKRK